MMPATDEQHASEQQQQQQQQPPPYAAARAQHQAEQQLLPPAAAAAAAARQHPQATSEQEQAAARQVGKATAFPALSSIHFATAGTPADGAAGLVGDQSFDSAAYAAYQSMFDVPGGRHAPTLRRRRAAADAGAHVQTGPAAAAAPAQPNLSAVPAPQLQPGQPAASCPASSASLTTGESGCIGLGCMTIAQSCSAC